MKELLDYCRCTEKRLRDYFRFSEVCVLLVTKAEVGPNPQTSNEVFSE